MDAMVCQNTDVIWVIGQVSQAGILIVLICFVVLFRRSLRSLQDQCSRIENRLGGSWR